ncbi:HNH endonuclease [Ferirhizobium litorale]|uniref:Putative HNH nuclease YajD n=1 Tax=Ferirhizobium litorale TaxID=2927786 RepID=A0AAE3QHC5_9HYPH|nr:HNH endonuclease signature motif containing protein [Fererhizobium litorale]MDI7923391.1 HNH endonuclease [Fererhizobium litorale]
MSKLTTLKPRLSSASHTISKSAPITRDQERAQRAPWRKWYSLKRWRDMRWDVLVEAMFTCQMCGTLERDTSRLVADHRKPHRGDPVLFWDRANLQCLCEPCHSTEKQKEEQATPAGVWW